MNPKIQQLLKQLPNPADGYYSWEYKYLGVIDERVYFVLTVYYNHKSQPIRSNIPVYRFQNNEVYHIIQAAYYMLQPITKKFRHLSLDDFIKQYGV